MEGRYYSEGGREGGREKCMGWATEGGKGKVIEDRCAENERKRKEGRKGRERKGREGKLRKRNALIKQTKESRKNK